MRPGPTNSTCRTSNIFAMATSRCWRRFTQPRGRGAFPALVDLHGGAWCLADRNTDKVRHEVLAGTWRGSWFRSTGGRQGGAYPLALADINYSIRWVKLHAKELKTRRTSSASPASRAAAIWRCWPPCAQRSAIHGDFAAGRLAGARRHVKAVVLSWRLINPLGRYRFAKRQARCPIRGVGRRGSSTSISSSGRRREHDRGQSDADPRARREGRAAAVDLAPGPGDVLHELQGTRTPSHRSPKPRVRQNYRKARQNIELHYFDTDRQPGHSPDLTKIGDTFENAGVYRQAFAALIVLHEAAGVHRSARGVAASGPLAAQAQSAACARSAC